VSAGAVVPAGAFWLLLLQPAKRNTAPKTAMMVIHCFMSALLSVHSYGACTDTIMAQND
jgi:hypothetical protein